MRLETRRLKGCDLLRGLRLVKEGGKVGVRMAMVSPYLRIEDNIFLDTEKAELTSVK